jgi:hypothetical protein
LAESVRPNHAPERSRYMLRLRLNAVRESILADS